MILAEHGPKSGSKHVCLIIAKTGQQGPVLYKGDKGVNDAGRSPEGGPIKARGLSASSLPLFGLVSLFNSISTFVGYLMLKPFSQKNSSGTI